MSNIEQLFGLKPMPKIYTNTRAKPLVASCASLLYGVELEIENARNVEEWNTPGTVFKEDNSLRNHGIEVVTSPMTISILNYVLTNFFEKSKVNESNYSERCSVHVHANCRDLTPEQVATVCLLYQVFEHLFYRFVGNDRDKNIFCVPWHETILTYNIVPELYKNNYGKLKQWMKYTGLNLLPLFSFGTLEFRQMAGEYDKERIINWCQLIGCLFEHARNNPLDTVQKQLIELNTTSEYRNVLDLVFQQWADLLRVPDYDLLLEEGVLNMKYSILNPAEAGASKKTSWMDAVDVFTAEMASDFVAPPLRLRPRPVPERAARTDYDQNPLAGGEWIVRRNMPEVAE